MDTKAAQLEFDSEEKVYEYYKKTDSKIIIYEGTVYDVVDYVSLHPGGSHFISDLYGKSIDEAFEDQGHSRNAKKLFKEFPVVGTVPKLLKNKNQLSATSLEGQKLESRLVVDYNKGIFNQLWNRTDYTFDDYVQFINEPKHLINPVRNCRIFDQGFFEAFSFTPWYAIPIAFLPQMAYFISLGLEVENPFWLDIACFIYGFFSWTLTEYMLHRFFFHSEDYWLPNHRKILALHWVIHGIHHTFPQEKLRLVFPIAPGLIIMYGMIYPTLKFVYPYEWHFMIQAGLTLGYIAYDMLHYYFHHSSPHFEWVREMKQYHMQHHYRNGQVKFGVSNKFWDRIFST